MDVDYLKSRADIQLVREAISAANKLEHAEYGIKKFKPEFMEASRRITDELGMELWHTEADGGRYFWRYQGRESTLYESRTSALKALLNEEIEWK
jgi:hypothetical protein